MSRFRGFDLNYTRVHFGEAVQEASLSASLDGKDRPDTVKIITGMRRNGMAVLMKQCIGLLKESGVPDSKSCT